MAGLPRTAVDRAKAVLARLEAGKGGRNSGIVEELPLFAGAPAIDVGAQYFAAVACSRS